jgi:imidazolonepropionase
MLGELGIIPRGGLLVQGDVILRAGPTRTLEREALRLRAEVVECDGRVVMPGFVDAHTHLVFAGSRANDYEMCLHGKTYAEIARAGGGIQSSARKLRHASHAALKQQAQKFLEQMAAHGTTTVEVKTGYGLEIAQELKILRVIRSLQAESPLELVPTLLAAHALPASFRGRSRQFANQVIKRLIPLAAREKLAEFIDCFCDRGAFSVEDCRRVLAAGKQFGLIPRIHAEQLTRTGAARLGIALDAASADHLDKLTAADIRALARSSVVATLLPGANFHLGLRSYPPARRLIAAGAAVALASDFNPGTSPTLNMQFILSLACTQMRMTPAEAITAATLNGACALRRSPRIGSLEPGKQADFIVLDVADYREIPYYFAVNHCVMTVKRGGIICQVSDIRFKIQDSKSKSKIQGSRFTVQNP